MNQGGDKKIKSFTDLAAWKEGHILVISTYKISKKFPRDEVFGIISQMRRCAVSITSNIAEGFSRFSFKDKAHFYTIALGSTTELQNQLLIARDVKYLDSENFDMLANQAIKVHKIINGLIKSSRQTQTTIINNHNS